MRVDVGGVPAFIGTGSRAQPPGVADKEALLFVHGAGMDHTVWVMQTRYFARHGHRVLAPDLPGHGRSGGQPLTTIEAMAEWLADLLDVLAVERAALVGHSMGSLVAYVLAARHPDRVTRLVLLGTSLPMPVSDALLDAAAGEDHAAVEMANVWSHSARGSLGGNPLPGMFVLIGGQRLLERCAPGAFHADLGACNGFDPEAVPVPAVPATVVVATEDRMTPLAAGREAAARLGDGVRVRTLQGSGHSMMSERPNEVLDILVEALTEVS